MDRTIDNIIESTLLKMRESQCCRESTIDKYRRIYGKLRCYCADREISYYQISIGSKFIDYYDITLKTPKKTLTLYRTAIKWLDCEYQNIKMQKGPFGRKPLEYDSSCFDDIRDLYEKRLIESGKQIRDVRSRMLCVSRFLSFLENQGYSCLQTVSSKEVHTAFENATDKGRFRRLVGHFLSYAYRHELTNENLYHYIPKPVRHKAVPSIYTQSEIEQLLSSIDRTTKTGKRNYAIVLIDARLGLRASDIAGLTFDSLTSSKVKIAKQQKTKNPHTLPYLQDVEEAITDYITNARQNIDDPHIFLNIFNDTPISAANIGKIVELAIKASGIDTTHKRKGSHALRSSLASALIEEGNDYATVQQVLGQSDIRSTKTYVSVSIERLREYAVEVPEASGLFERLIEETKR